MSQPTEKDEIDVDEFSQNNSYNAPAQRSVQEIVSADNNDESLKRYKKSLLKNAAQGDTVIIDASNANNVIVSKIAIVIGDDVKFQESLPTDQEFTWTVKEGSEYKMQLEFFVQREISTGLRYLHKITRLGLQVAKESFMLGSYAPKLEPYTYTSPVEEAPSGLLSRGKYRVRSLITDDDKNRWLEWIWYIDIVK